MFIVSSRSRRLSYCCWGFCRAVLPNLKAHPLDTKAVPRDAEFLAECSIKGVMACKIMSALSGDYGAEKRSACIAYRDSNWRLVEQCGSLPARQP